MADRNITNNADPEPLEQPKRLLKGQMPDPPREKRERTPAQIAAFERARDSRAKNLAKREADAKRLAEYDAMILKQKIKEKADRIKVKTMKKIEAIESVPSDDEEVIERPRQPPAPRVNEPQVRVSRDNGMKQEQPKPTPKPTETPKPKIVPYKFV